MAFPSDLSRTKTWSTEVLTASDLHGQLDLIINWAMAVVNASTGHTHDGTSNQGPKIPITNLTVGSQAQGDIIYASSATAWARLGYGTAGYLLKTQGAGANPTWVNIAADSSYLPAGSVVQVVNTLNVAMTTIATAIPYDDTIPQISEGGAVMSRAITPTNASNNLLIRATVCWSNNTGATYNTLALFQDSTANALACTTLFYGTGTQLPQISTLEYYMTAGTTSSTTFSLRLGDNSGNTITINGVNGARVYGGSLTCSLTVTEIKA